MSELDSLEMLHATDVLASSSRHTHETLTLGIIEQGTAFLSHKEEPYSLSSGCVVVINPDDAHACHPENSLGYSQRMMYPSVALLEQATYEVTARSHLIPLFEKPVIADEMLGRQVQSLFQTLETSSCALFQETQLLQTLISLICTHAKIPPIQIQPVNAEPKAVRQTREYLEENYAENSSLSQLAALTHLSPFHLSRVFYRAVGLPPHLYLTQIRVLRAKNCWLRDGRSLTLPKKSALLIRAICIDISRNLLELLQSNIKTARMCKISLPDFFRVKWLQIL